MKTYTTVEALKILDERSWLKFTSVNSKGEFNSERKLYCKEVKRDGKVQKVIKPAFRETEIAELWGLKETKVGFREAIRCFSNGYPIACTVNNSLNIKTNIKRIYIPRDEQSKFDGLEGLDELLNEYSPITPDEVLNGSWGVLGL